MTEQLRFPDQSFACANRTAQRFGTDLRIPYHASFSTSRFRSRDSGGETQQARKYFGGLLFNFQVTRAPAHHPSVAGLCSSVFFSKCTCYISTPIFSREGAYPSRSSTNGSTALGAYPSKDIRVASSSGSTTARISIHSSVGNQKEKKNGTGLEIFVS